MSAAFHIACLGALTLATVFWSRNGWTNVTCKVGYAGLSAWAAVMVAKDALA